MLRLELKMGDLRVARALLNLPLNAVLDEAILTLYGVEGFPNSNGGQFGDNSLRIQLI